jgi:predicted O-methyltransferase YrrM
MASVTLNKIRGEFKERGFRGVVTSAFERPGRWVRAYRELDRHKRFDQSAELLSYARTLGSGWFNPGQVDSEICALLDQVRGLRPHVVLEIGTMNGGTLFMFTRVAAPDAMLISIDLPGGAFGGGYPQWRAPLYRRFALPGQNVRLLRGDSQDQGIVDGLQRILGQRSIDFLFIDGDHSYEGVKKDHQTYAKFVRRRGIIAFHDVAPHSDLECQVSRYWRELAAERFNCETLIESVEQGWGGIGLYLVE